MKKIAFISCFIIFVQITGAGLCQNTAYAQPTVVQQWNEQILEAIRNDFARPNVHARNLFHLSAAMYDAWAIYDEIAEPYLIGNRLGDFQSGFTGIEQPGNIDAARKEAISTAAYTLIRHRFQYSPGAEGTFLRTDSLLLALGYNIDRAGNGYESGSAASLGKFIGEQYIAFGLVDGTKEQFDYGNEAYLPVNDPLIPSEPGNPGMRDPNRWQPLGFETFVDQSGNEFPDTAPEFLGAEWGNVIPFALNNSDITQHERDGLGFNVYLDPGPPPFYNPADSVSAEQFLWSFTRVPVWSSFHDPDDGVWMDASPASIGNVSHFPGDFSGHESFYGFVFDGIDNFGHERNPITGQPYESQYVPRGDFTRVISEYWADGPASETPPGHWFTILNSIADHPEISRKIGGYGEALTRLEWDVKMYFALGGAMHDAAISAWSVKGWYDYVRPISALRWLADNGQRSDPNEISYHPDGIPLIDGYISIVKEDDPLAGENGEHVGKIKLYTWRGHNYIHDQEKDVAGVGWILAENWWPYQQPTFVTPPFAGYVSGHSTYSHAAAALLENFTGDPFFPGGIARFVAGKNEYLEFEKGPSMDIELQWATYRDAAAQSSISRIWGGIHPPIDDIPGRVIGLEVGKRAFIKAEEYFSGTATSAENLTEKEVSPGVWQLYQNYPNPFNPSTTITFHIAEAATVELRVYDLAGRQVASLVRGNRAAGIHQVNWDADAMASGLYIYRISAVSQRNGYHFTETRRMMLIK